MNCKAVREQLLQCDDPSRPPAILLRHLGRCLACQAIRQRLLEVESATRAIPVPATAGRDLLMARLQEGELPTPPLAPRPSPWRSSLKDRAHQKLALALALAASLALFAIGWGFWPHGTPTIDARKAERITLVERAATPRDRVRAMSAFVRRLEIDVLQPSSQTPAEQIETLSAFYVELVENDLPALVQALSAGERAALLPEVLEQLRRGESDLSRAMVDRHNPEMLQRMVQATRTGSTRLRALAA